MSEKAEGTRAIEEIVARATRNDVSAVSDESGPGTLKRWDSFKHIQIVLAIEERYRVKFDTGEIERLRSVAQLKEALRKKGVDL